MSRLLSHSRLIHLFKIKKEGIKLPSFLINLISLGQVFANQTFNNDLF